MSKQLWGNRKPPPLLSFPYVQGNDGGREVSRIREVEDYIWRHNSAITELKTKLGLSDSDVPITVTGREGRPSTFAPDIFKEFVNDLDLITNIRWPTSMQRGPYIRSAGKTYWQSSETPLWFSGGEWPAPRCGLRYLVSSPKLVSDIVANAPSARQWLVNNY